MGVFLGSLGVSITLAILGITEMLIVILEAIACFYIAVFEPVHVPKNLNFSAPFFFSFFIIA